MKFLFLGNGTSNNHGCEAIVRGTVRILAKAFESEITAANGVNDTPEIVNEVERHFKVPNVDTFSIYSPKSPMLSIKWRLAHLTSDECVTHASEIKQHGAGAKAMLAIGGDNFSMDYGLPTFYLGWNKVASTMGLPSFIWGASVGPFSRDPQFEARFVKHAARLKGFLVRETRTQKYLESLGLGDKTFLVGDPAFVMSVTEPKEKVTLPEGGIGLNLSPLYAKYVADGNVNKLKELAVDYVKGIRQSLKRPVILIPHVNSNEASRKSDPTWYAKDDFGFLSKVYEALGSDASDVHLIGDTYNAEELKWIISQCHSFIGARTHSTIAAFSTHTPTISLAYSVKAQGLNEDIFGSTDYCIAPKDLSKEKLIEALQLTEVKREEILAQYQSSIPVIQERAYQAGQLVKEMIS